MSTGNSRTADKFVIRLPDGMRDQVKARADDRFISMNGWVLQAIDEKLRSEQKKERNHARA